MTTHSHTEFWINYLLPLCVWAGWVCMHVWLCMTFLCQLCVVGEYWTSIGSVRECVFDCVCIPACAAVICLGLQQCWLVHLKYLWACFFPSLLLPIHRIEDGKLSLRSVAERERESERWGCEGSMLSTQIWGRCWMSFHLTPPSTHDYTLHTDTDHHCSTGKPCKWRWTHGSKVCHHAYCTW